MGIHIIRFFLQMIWCLLLRGKDLREICVVIYTMPSSYIIINYKLREYLGAKLTLFMVTKKRAFVD